jgi:hypothetical protein
LSEMLVWDLATFIDFSISIFGKSSQKKRPHNGVFFLQKLI